MGKTITNTNSSERIRTDYCESKLPARLLSVGEVAGLEVLLVGNSGSKKTRVTVLVGKPLPLFSILKKMPSVNSVIEKENSIQVVLETSADK